MRTFCSKIQLCVFFVLSLTIPILFQIQPASALLVDFESYPSGSSTSHFDNIGTQFSSWGFSVSSQNDYGNVVDAVIRQDALPWLNYASGISALAPWVGDGTYYGPAQAPISISFDSPIDYFSIYAMDVGWNGLLVQAYDLSSTLISSISIDGTGRNHDGPPGGDGLDFIQFALSGISSITFSQIHDPDWDEANDLGTEGYLLDNLCYMYSIPDASCALLLGSAFICFLARTLRRLK